MVVGAVLVPGGRAPMLVTADMVANMKPGALIVDVAIDQGGCIETSHETTHADPVFEVNGVLHYCVGNVPGAVPHTSTYALANATLPYLVDIAIQGPERAVTTDQALAGGLNTLSGHVVNPAVAEALHLPATPSAELWGG
jgi:alanine dehydrogenase